MSDRVSGRLADRYDEMLRLADLFDAAGAELRDRSELGAQVLADPDVADSAELSPPTWAVAEEEVRSATTGKDGLLTRSVELDADALVVRATVLTYRWIDELQDAAYRTLGSIAGRAVGYLAPQVALGGAVVSAGLIETDALDRDGVAGYLSELAENNPELMDHVTSGGGGLVDGLQMRALLTTPGLAGDDAAAAGRGGLRALGVDPFAVDGAAALRDTAGTLLDLPEEAPTGSSSGPPAPAQAPHPVRPHGHRATPDIAAPPRSLEELMATLAQVPGNVAVHRVGPDRFIAYLAGPDQGSGRRLRLVGGDHGVYADQVVRAVEAAVAAIEEREPEEGGTEVGGTEVDGTEVDGTEVDGATPRVMLVGAVHGGVAAAGVAATAPGSGRSFVVDRVVTAGAPSAQVPRLPEGTRMLALEDRTDPVALLGSLVNATDTSRLTVVFDGGGERGHAAYVAGGRAADSSGHPEVRDEIRRLREQGYLGT